MPDAFKLTWDDTGKKLFETGIDRGVLYPYVTPAQNADTTASGYTPYSAGVAWNGLTSVSESPSGADSNKQYADNGVYANLRGAEEFGGTIEAFTYPDEWMECDGSAVVATGIVAGQQNRKSFGLSYRTLIGNDTAGLDYGYKIHLVYGATASPSERSYETVNDSPEAATMSWEYDTVPVGITIDGTTKKTALLTIDSTKVDSTKLGTFEAILYGTTGTGAADAKLPLPDDVIAHFA